MINENIKNARKAKGMSQEEMAIKLDVVRQTVSKWEKGLSVPDADVLIRMADLLEVSVNDLLGIRPPNSTTEDLASELAKLNEQLAIKSREATLSRLAGEKRGLILFLSFISMVVAMSIKNELLSIILIGGCILAALIILYRNLALLTKITTDDLRIGVLNATTVFNIIVLIAVVSIVALDRSAMLSLSGSNEKSFVLVLTCIIMLFVGFISPKLPFTRHTGLRLPWIVQDEDTWNVAHKIIGYISLPLVLLYLSAVFTIKKIEFEVISITVILLWIGIPALISLAFWRKKNHGRS